MKTIFRQLQVEAIRIAREHPAPAFYRDFAEEISRSVHFFVTDSRIKRIRDYVAEHLEDDFGHGIDHARKVALDAGVLVLVEARGIGCGDDELTRLLRLAHCAGLLHDIRRKEKKHAAAGAKEAERVLAAWDFSSREIADVCLAIANHEAFGVNHGGETREGDLLSDCLYDADKFRWGPENFTQTLWSMLSYRDIPMETFLSHYPKGMAFLKKVRDTFRTPTGRVYGPQFIDIGIGIGDDLYELIRSEYADPVMPS